MNLPGSLWPPPNSPAAALPAPPDAAAGTRSDPATEQSGAASAAPMPAPAAVGRSASEPNDRIVRLFGIPAFALAISHGANLYGSLGPGDGTYWLALAYFVILSALIWQGNRFFLLRLRAHLDWFRQPGRKALSLIALNVLYTAPLTATWLWGWFRMTGDPAAHVALIQIVAVVNVVCVLFVTHVYETVDLIRQRLDDRLQVERLERARVEADLKALQSQIDPHFLFNSLNTLAQLIETRPADARVFCDDLADVYRYLLRCHSELLVPADDELAFARRYSALLKRRFGRAIAFSVDADVPEGALIPPISIQMLIENAVKHNAFSEESPLAIRIMDAPDSIVVSSDWRPLRSAGESSGIGLANLDERCRLLTRRGIRIERVEGTYRVAVPLLESVHA